MTGTPGFAAKVISLGVILKAILMATVVTLLGATSFTQSVILVLISATATGVFGLLIVFVQVRSEREIHNRMSAVEDKLDEKATVITDKVDEKAAVITDRMDETARVLKESQGAGQ